MTTVKAMLAEDMEVGKTLMLGDVIPDDDWVIAQKLDGVRLVVDYTGNHVDVLNRNGERYSRPKVVTQLLKACLNCLSVQDFAATFDGEYMDDGTYWMFDLPWLTGKVGKGTPFQERYLWLENLYHLAFRDSPVVKLLPYFAGIENKQLFFNECYFNKVEGVIFRRLSAPYSAGKRSPDLLKWKFAKRAEVVITALNIDGKDNCELSVLNPKYDGEQLIDKSMLMPVGKASILGKKPIVNLLDVWEVEYLELSKNDRLVQPRLKRIRIDKRACDCRYSQLERANKHILIP